jgi:hypothetical protein
VQECAWAAFAFRRSGQKKSPEPFVDSGLVVVRPSVGALLVGGSDVLAVFALGELALVVS